MDEIHLTPTKDTYSAIKADVDVHAAVKELYDNGIDNAHRQGRDSVTIELRCETTSDGEQVLVVEDNSGGLKADELSMVFALGESEKDDIKGSIGAFGIGAKKALMCLGQEFTIRSRHRDADVGYEYTIGQEWLTSDDEWSVPVSEVDMEAGTTELRVRDLNFTWSDLSDGLRTDLEQTYERFLQGKAPVTLRGLFPNEQNTGLESLTPPMRPSYSYTPWDDLYPRRYEGIVLDPVGVESTVHMNIEIGLLVTGDEDAAGIDWVCQDRVVERANRDDVSGFGNELPKFDPSTHKRLKGRVELYTEGDAADLSWNSDKSRIHSRHPVTDAARQVLKKVAKRYMRASYGTVEPAFFEPYTEDSRHAVHGGSVKIIDLSGKYQRLLQGDIQQVQINDKPTKGRPAIRDMQATATAHAHLGITYEYLEWVDLWMRPTYHALCEAKRDKFGCFDSLEELESPPPDFTQDGRSGESERQRLTDLAQDHANLGVRYTGLADWEQPRYQFELEAAVADRDIPIESLEAVDTLPETDGEDTDEDAVETKALSFGEFTEGELDLLSKHLGNIGEFTPAKRKEVLLEHFRRLNMAGVRFEVQAD